MSTKQEELEKAIDKSKNKLEIITDKNGHVKKVWKHVDGKEQPAGVNAGKSYEKTGQRHTSFEGFESGETVLLTVGGKEISGTFRHVNQSKHSTVAVVRGEDNKLYERGLSKIKKQETDGIPQVFKDIIKVSRDITHAYQLIAKMKNVSLDISKKFREKYDPEGKLSAQEAFENFYNEIKGIKKESLHIETQKLDKKKNPNFGGKKEDNFTDTSDKTSWQRGDSVTFIDKSGKEKLGRVLKVDKEMNMTTVRQANGLTETVSNKKIKL